MLSADCFKACRTANSTRSHLNQPTDQFLLFLGGGSRRNPGAGGPGSVRVDAHGGLPALKWTAAMISNNQVEYAGLVTGIRYAADKQLKPLTVIGHSLMIVSQLLQHSAPKNPRLRVSYGEARILADVHGVTQWHHHVRAFNKMADCAANMAMDSKCSVQTQHPTSRSTSQRRGMPPLQLFKSGLG